MNKRFFKFLSLLCFGILLFTGCTIKDHVHYYNELKYDETSHYYVCVCGDKIAYEHSYKVEVIKKPTCTEEGESRYTCDVCGYTTTKSTPALGHVPGNIVIENSVAETCTTDGKYDEVRYCTVCGEEVSRRTVTVAATGHNFGAPTYTWDGTTCTAQRVCSADNAVETESVNAVYQKLTDATCTAYETGKFVATFENSYFATQELPFVGDTLLEHPYTNWVFDSANHTHSKTCTSCGKVVTENCNFEETITTPATCETDGVKTYTCSVCGGSYTEVIPAKGHSLEHVEAKESTCIVNGNLEYYACKECGKLFSDAEGKHPTTLDAVTLPLGDHHYETFYVRQFSVTDGTQFLIVSNTSLNTMSTTQNTTTRGYSSITREKNGSTGVAVIDVKAKAQVLEAVYVETIDGVDYYAIRLVNDENGDPRSERLFLYTTGANDLLSGPATMVGDVETFEDNMLWQFQFKTASVHICNKTNVKTRIRYYQNDAGTTKRYDCYNSLVDGRYVSMYVLTNTNAALVNGCDFDGRIEYKHCLECDKYWDVNGNEITYEQTKVPAAHTLSKVEAVEPTCSAPGNSEYYVCSVCGKYFDKDNNEIAENSWVVEPNPNNHKYHYVEAVPGNCLVYALKDHYECDYCGKIFDKVDENYVEITASDLIIVDNIQTNYPIQFNAEQFNDSISSYANNWTLTANSMTFTLVNFNNNQKKWDYVKAGSKNTASVAEIIFPMIPYSVDRIGIAIDSVRAEYINSIKLLVADNAQFNNASEYSFVVEAGQQFVTLDKITSGAYYKVVIDIQQDTANGTIQISGLNLGLATVRPLGHILNAVEAVDPTYASEGNIAYYECSLCGQKFADEFGFEKVTNIVIPSLSTGLSLTESTDTFVKVTYNSANADVYPSVRLIDLANQNWNGQGFAIRVKNDTDINTPLDMQINDVYGNRSYLVNTNCAPYIIDLEGNWSRSTLARDFGHYVMIPANFDGWLFFDYNEMVARADFNSGAPFNKEINVWGLFVILNPHYDSYAAIEFGAVCVLRNNEFVTVINPHSGTCANWSNVALKDYEGEYINFALTGDHIYQHHDAVEAGCETTGMDEYYECSICHWYYNANKEPVTYDSLVRPANGHIFVHHDKVEPTYTETGLEEHYTCEHCEKYFDKNKNEVSYTDLIIPVKEYPVATTDMVVYDLDGKTTENLQQDIAITKYSNGWVSTTATVTLGSGYHGDKVISMNCWDNYVDFRYSFNYSTTKYYKSIKFTATGNGITTLRLRLYNSTSGVYATYNLGTLLAGTHDYTVALTDSGWVITSGGNDYSFAQIKQAGMVEWEDATCMTAMFDQIQFLLKGATSQGYSTKVLVNNFIFSATDNTTSHVAKVGNANLYLDFSDGAGSGTYSNANWQDRYYGNNGWTEWKATTQMNSRSLDGNKNVNLVASASTRTFKYDPAEDIGLTKYVAIKMGNYFSSSVDIKVKISLVDVYGQKTYILGDANNFVTLPKVLNSGYSNADLFKELDKAIEVDCFEITVLASSNSYLYIDDIALLKEDRADHVYYLPVKVNPTCEAKGSLTYTCKICGHEHVVEIDKLDHNMTHHNAVSATCTNDGTIEYYSCSLCNKNYADANGTILLDSIVENALGHHLTHVEAKDPTLLEEGNIEYYYCDRCEKYFAEETCTTELTNVTVAKLTKVIEATTDTFVKVSYIQTTSDSYPEVRIYSNEGNRNWTGSAILVRIKNDTAIDTPLELQINDVSGSRGYVVDTNKPTILVDLEGNWYYTPTVRNWGHYTVVPANFDGWLYLPYESMVDRADYGTNPYNKNIDTWGLFAIINPKYDSYAQIEFGAVIAVGETNRLVLNPADNCAHWFNNAQQNYLPEYTKLTALNDCDYVHHDAVPATCEATGMAEYYECSICHWFFNANKEGVTADSLILPAKGHTFVHHDKVEATFTDTGLEEHYTCENCEKYFDKNKNEVAYTDLIIPVKVNPVATEDMVVYDLDGKTTENLQNDIKVEKYSNGWTTTSATVTLGSGYHGDKVISMNCWDNYTDFRYTFNYETVKYYKSIKFTATGNGITTLKLRLNNSTSGIYATYDLGTLLAGTHNYTVALTDSGWVITVGGNNYSFAQIKAANMVQAEDATCMTTMFDQIQFLLKGATSQGYSTKVLVNNFIFSASDSTTSHTALVADANLFLDFSDGAGSGTYSNANWQARSYTDKGWTDWATTTQMNSRALNGNKNVNLVADGSTRTFRYNPNEDIGLTKYAAIKMGNYFSSNVDIKVKISLIDVYGVKTYLLGDANNFVTVSKVLNGGYTADLFVELPKAIEVDHFEITVQASAQSYLYIDEIALLKEDRAEHVYYEYATTPATCTEAGSKDRTCKICGHVDHQEISPLGHNAQYVDAVAPTHLSEGTIEHWHCDRCNKDFADEACTTEVTELSVAKTKFVIDSHNDTAVKVTMGPATDDDKVVMIKIIDWSKTNWMGEGFAIRVKNLAAVETPLTGELIDNNSPTGRSWLLETGASPYFVDFEGNWTRGTNNRDWGHYAMIPASFDGWVYFSYDEMVNREDIGPAWSNILGCTGLLLSLSSKYDSYSVIEYGSVVVYRDNTWVTVVDGHSVCEHWNSNKYVKDLNGNLLTIDPVGKCTYIHYDATPATCEDDGIAEHYKCTNCNWYFDANKNPTVAGNLVIPALGHSYSDWSVTVEPTCTTKGQESRTCSVCNEVENRDIDALGHNLSHVEAVASTCEVNGNSEYYKCLTCEKLFSDSLGTNEIALADTVLPLLAHTYETFYVRQFSVENGTQFLLVANKNLYTMSTTQNTSTRGYSGITRENSNGVGVAVTNVKNAAQRLEAVYVETVDGVDFYAIRLVNDSNGNPRTDRVFLYCTGANNVLLSGPSTMVGDVETFDDNMLWQFKFKTSSVHICSKLNEDVRIRYYQYEKDGETKRRFDTYESLGDGKYISMYVLTDTNAAIEEGCFEGNGRIQYKHCTACDKYWDVNGNEITLEDTVVTPHGHDYVAVTSGTETYYECSRCGSLAQLVEDTYSYTFNSGVFTKNDTKELNGLNWTLTNDGSYYGYDGTKGNQIGSSGAPAKSLTLSTNDYTSPVTKIIVNTSGASSISAKLTVTVNGVQYGQIINLTSSATSYTFEVDGAAQSGEILLSYTQTSSKAIYIKSISVISSGYSELDKNYLKNKAAAAVNALSYEASYDSDVQLIAMKDNCEITYYSDAELTNELTSNTIARTTEVQNITIYAVASFGSHKSEKKEISFTITAIPSLVLFNYQNGENYSFQIDVASGEVNPGTVAHIDWTINDGYQFVRIYNAYNDLNTVLSISKGDALTINEPYILKIDVEAIPSEVTVKKVFSECGYSNAQEINTVQFDDKVSVTFAKGSNNNAPKYYTSGTAIRCYGSNSITVSVSEGYKITSIKLTYGSSDGSNAISSDVESFEGNTWSGSSQSVKLTISGTSGNRRIAAIEVTYEIA